MNSQLSTPFPSSDNEYMQVSRSSSINMSIIQIRHKRGIEAIRPSYRPSMEEHEPATLHHQATSSTTVTVPRRSIANRHCNRRLHMCANRKLHSSELFGRSGPTYTPYHMVAESRPLYLLLCLIGAPLRLQRQYHADPLLTGTAIVVYICVPIANYTVASSLADQDQPTHHTIWWRRVDLYTSCFASSGPLFDYSDSTTPIHC